MKTLNLIFFISLASSSYCGLILHNIRDELHSKLYGHGLHGESNQNSPIITINNQQQIAQSASSMSQHHIPNGPRGDYGSLPHSGHHVYGSNFKVGGSSSYGHHALNNGYDSSYYGSHHHMDGGSTAGGFRGDNGSGISSHQMMKQESYKRRDGPKFGYHHDNNMFGNAQGVSANNGVPMFSSSSSASSSASSSSSSSAVAASSSASSSSSSSFVGSGGLRPWNRRY